ncbi:hypothetical protein DFH11DRAFT_1518304 [Phellopilus nigrolimitatus]|nr:hypothetical protein DFH11DRAFT_1518304 [Phellopilus nigrolimitatus]
MRLSLRVLTLAATAAAALPGALGGPLAYALCQTGCNTGVVACYAAAGFTFGTVPIVGAPAAIMGCNALLGTCVLVFLSYPVQLLCVPLTVRG